METHHYWEENGHSNKYEKYSIAQDYGSVGNEQLNFAVPSEDEDYQAGEYSAAGYAKKGKLSRQDPMSHRIIEKRRRDRMNNCLADLSRLIPPEYLKKGRGRVEKTEIIEMAIRHLKYLQERFNAAERQAADEYRAGFQEAMAEAVRFLVDVKGYGQSEGVCSQLAAHLQRHSELLFKGDPLRREKIHSQPAFPSEAGNNSGSLHGYAPKGVITRLGPDPQEFYPLPYENKCAGSYPMECEPALMFQGPTPLEADTGAPPVPLDNRQKRETTLRTVRKPEHDDYLHSYKFKNSIERRFSMSQDCQVRKKDDKTVPTPEATDMSVRFKYQNKRACPSKPDAPAPAPAPCPRSTNSASNSFTSDSNSLPTLSSNSNSASNSTSNDDAQENSPRRETSSASNSPDHQHFDKPSPTQFVPVFALNTQGKYYVPLSVEWACVSRQLRASSAAAAPPPLHPVTIYVNFQPCLNYHVKQEPDPADWQP